MTTTATPTTETEPRATKFAQVVDVASRVLVGTIALAIVWNSYTAMVAFCVDRIELAHQDAQIVAITIEGALLAAAVLSLRNALRGRSYTALMTATWLLAALSGVFAGADQIYLGHGIWGALFRFSVPLIGAWLIHALLNIDKSQAAGFNVLADFKKAQQGFVTKFKAEQKTRKVARAADKLMLAHIRASEAVCNELELAEREGRTPKGMEQLKRTEQHTEKLAIELMGIREFARRYGIWITSLKEAAKLRTELYAIKRPVTLPSLSPVQSALASTTERPSQGSKMPAITDHQAQPPVPARQTSPAPKRQARPVSTRTESRASVDTAGPRRSSSTAAKEERADRARIMSAAGKDNWEIAEELKCSIRTVERALQRDREVPANTPGGGVPVVRSATAELVGAR